MSAVLSAVISDLDFSNPVTITGNYARSLYREISEPGWGSITLVKGMAETLGLLEGEKLITFKANGVALLTIVADPVERRILTQGEDGDEFTLIPGPGHFALLRHGRVGPNLLPSGSPNDDTRRINWTASAYDDTGPEWITANEVMSVGTAKTAWSLPFGAGFVDDAAMILWSGGTDDDGTSYFRSPVVSLDAGWYMAQFGVDNFGDLYANGQLLISLPEGPIIGNFTEVHEQLCYFPAGDYVFAIEGTNLNEPAVPAHPGGVAFALHPFDGVGLLTTSVLHTDSTWVMVDRPAEPPGITWGAAALILLDESQARGELAGWVPTFTATQDSSSAAWPQIADVTTSVGIDFASFCGEGADTHCDIEAVPGALELAAYLYGTQTGPTPSASPNIVENVQRGTGRQADRILARWSGGWEVVEIDPLPADVRTETLYLGHIDSLAEVHRICDARLDQWARSQREIDVVIKPRPGFDHLDLPGTAYQLGSILVGILDENGDGHDERLRGFSLTEDDTNGSVLVVTRLRDVLREAAERAERTQRKLSPGDGGGSRVAQPVAGGGGRAGNERQPTGQSAGWLLSWSTGYGAWVLSSILNVAELDAGAIHYREGNANSNDASGSYAHAEGQDTTASGNRAHAENNGTDATGADSHAEGRDSLASASQSHAEGDGTQATGQAAHAEGSSTIASGVASHAEGESTQATAADAHAEGQSTQATDVAAHAEGGGSQAVEEYSHAQGYGSKAWRYGEHAESSFGPVNSGLGQVSRVTLNHQTTDATQTTLVLGNTTDDLKLTDNCLSVIRGVLGARRSDGSVVSAWKVDVVAEMDSGTSRIVGTPAITMIAQDAGAAAWAVAVVTSATGLAVKVTGAAATTIDWFALIEIAETV